MVWKTVDQRKIDKRRNDAHKRIFFYGTPEKCYRDSGFWEFITYVKTFDEHDELNPVKPFIKSGEDLEEYLQVLFWLMLANPDLAIDKSRQMRVSWALAVFNCWYARTAPFRSITVQSKKEADAYKLVSLGREYPLQGRMSFIEHNLPQKWLGCYNICSGNGNRAGHLVYWNNSVVMALPQGADQIRSNVPTLYVGDEAAFLDDFDATRAAVLPAAKRQVVCSSPWPGQFKEFLFKYEQEHGGVLMPDGTTRQFPGLKSWINSSGTYCLQINYRADPRKDPERKGRKWYEAEVRKAGGPHSVKWRREMENDWEIMGSEPVFPFAADDDWAGFIPRLDPDDVAKNMKLVAGFDYGTRNPSAFIVWAADKHGNQYAVWEIYEPCQNYKRLAQKIKDCPYFGLLGEMRADPEIWRANQRRRDGSTCTVADLFAEEGVHFRPGRRAADVPVAHRFLGSYWSDPSKPTAFITAACPHLKREIKLLHWAEHTTAVAMATKPNPEAIVDKDNHAWDATAYIMDSRTREYQEEKDARDISWTFEAMSQEIRGRDKNHGRFIGQLA